MIEHSLSLKEKREAGNPLFGLEENSILNKGDKVSFEADKAPKGFKAINVRKIS